MKIFCLHALEVQKGSILVDHTPSSASHGTLKLLIYTWTSYDNVGNLLHHIYCTAQVFARMIWIAWDNKIVNYRNATLISLAKYKILSYDEYSQVPHPL